MQEAARWVPSLSTLRFHGIANERNRIKDILRHGKMEQPHILFTTYETFVAEDSWFKSQRWKYCVLDEGHKIKNSDTNIAGKLQGLGSLYRLSEDFFFGYCLSPITNCDMTSFDWNASSKQFG